jgi:hypothetical protein
VGPAKICELSKCLNTPHVPIHVIASSEITARPWNVVDVTLLHLAPKRALWLQYPRSRICLTLVRTIMCVVLFIAT